MHLLLLSVPFMFGLGSIRTLALVDLAWLALRTVRGWLGLRLRYSPMRTLLNGCIHPWSARLLLLL
jgi:hypothetical protein